MSSLTFGQLVKNQMQNPSADVVKAAEYVIEFGKHKGMNMSMLMEEQNGYCQWLLKQDQIGDSQNPKFNDAVYHLKILIADKQGLKIDGVELVDGEMAILHIDPANPEVNGVYHENPNYKVDPPSKILVNGLLMGAVTDLMKQVDEGLTFDFSHEDIDLWLALVSQVELGVNQFVIIETTHKSSASHAQKIKMVVSDLKKLKGVF